MHPKKVFILILLGIILLGCGCFACSGAYLVWNRLTFEPNQVNFPLQEKWVFEVEGDIKSTPGISGDYVVIRTRKGIYTFNAVQGELLWYVPFEDRYNNNVTNPLIHQNKVFVMKSDRMIALDLATGEVVWTVSDSVYERKMYIAGVTEKVVVFVRTSIIVRDIETGELVWEVSPAGLSPTVVIAKGQVHAFTNNQFLVYDLESGDLQKEILTEGKRGDGGEYFGGNHFYIRGNEGLFAYDVETKEIVWQREDFKHVNYPIYLYGDMLLLSDYYPIALNLKKGRKLWHNTDVGTIERFHTPLVVDYVVYVLGENTRRVYALNPANGEVIGYLKVHPSTYLANVPESPGPVQYKDSIIFAIDNYLYAYGP